MTAKVFKALGIVCLCTFGCTPSVSSPVTETSFTVPTAQIQATDEINTTIEASATPRGATGLERAQYTFEARLDYAQHSLEVVQTILYPNHTGEVLHELALVIEPSRYPGSFVLHGIRRGGSTEIASYALEGGVLRVPLATPLQADEMIELHLDYDLRLPAQPSPFGYTTHLASFSDWYPFTPPYKPGEGWWVNEPGVTGEHLVYETADFEFTLQGTPFGVMVAAPGVLSSEGGNTIYRLEGARRFSWAASPEYVRLESEEDGIPVSAYVFPEHQAAAQGALRAAEEALAVYGELWGQYPFENLVIVESTFGDGLESDGIIYMDYMFFQAYSGTPGNMLTTLVAHETAHQWWYGLVGNDPAREPWLDEALATYSELLYYERAHPDLVEWWWDFRVDSLEPTGWVNGSIYEQEGYYPYVKAVYLRGARFMDALRRQTGDEMFFAFLRDYAERGRYGIFTGEDFFEILGMHTEEDFGAILAEYFEGQE